MICLHVKMTQFAVQVCANFMTDTVMARVKPWYFQILTPMYGAQNR